MKIFDDPRRISQRLSLKHDKLDKEYYKYDRLLTCLLKYSREKTKFSDIPLDNINLISLLEPIRGV